MVYQRGEDVIHCEPFSHVLKSSFLSDYCNFCLKFKGECSLKQCGGCKKIFYCGPLCHKNAWHSYHREECQYLRILPSVPEEHIRILFRIVIKLNNTEKSIDKEFDVLPDGRKRYFKDLMSHEREIVVDPSRLEEFKTVYIRKQLILPLIIKRIKFQSDVIVLC